MGWEVSWEKRSEEEGHVPVQTMKVVAKDLQYRIEKNKKKTIWKLEKNVNVLIRWTGLHEYVEDLHWTWMVHQYSDTSWYSMFWTHACSPPRKHAWLPLGIHASMTLGDHALSHTRWEHFITLDMYPNI